MPRTTQSRHEEQMQRTATTQGQARKRVCEKLGYRSGNCRVARQVQSGLSRVVEVGLSARRSRSRRKVHLRGPAPETPRFTALGQQHAAEDKPGPGRQPACPGVRPFPAFLCLSPQGEAPLVVRATHASPLLAQSGKSRGSGGRPPGEVSGPPHEMTSSARDAADGPISRTWDEHNESVCGSRRRQCFSHTL